MHYKFFTNSEKAWKSMFEAMQEAKKSIYLEMYIFQNDTEDFDFFNLLKEKASSGLTVKIILDSFGSAGLPGDAISELKRAGVEIFFLSHFLHRMHRKVLIIDERVAFMGGVNLYQSSRFWKDLMVRIEGSLVKKIMLSFAKAYANAGGTSNLGSWLPKKSAKIPETEIKEDTWIVEHSPLKKKFQFNKIYKNYLNKAERSILFITPYFIPKRWLKAALHQAVLRGINVEVLMPKSTDHFITDRVNYFHIYKLSKLGVKFYLEPEMNHGKAIIIDEKEAMVGSQNLDFFSFDFNSEVGIFFRDKEAVAKLLEIGKEWRKDAVFFDYQAYRPKWFDYILSPLIHLFNFFFGIF